MKFLRSHISNPAVIVPLVILAYLAGFFLIMLVQALALRFTVTWGIDAASWYRQVLNNLAGAVGA